MMVKVCINYVMSRCTDDHGADVYSSRSHKLRMIRCSPSSSSDPPILYEPFPLTQEIMRVTRTKTRQNRSVDIIRRYRSSIISSAHDKDLEMKCIELQTGCSFFDRCDEATQTETQQVDRCCCIIS